MKHVERHTKTYEYERWTYTCSKCGADANDDSVPAGISAQKVAVRIHRLETESYPSGGWTEGVAIDCCSSCFERVVVPALTALGFETRVDKRDW